MPIVHIQMLEGRDAATVSHCLREVARVVHQTLSAPLETIRVVATEVPHTHWAIGDRTRSDIEAEKKAAQAEPAS